ncbi:MAG TPA: cytochrome c biogenesis protein CcdA [Terriglobia bacterium]|nr:cytochrome c biogenesis protein CcdA [Terriglobia bacterium]
MEGSIGFAIVTAFFAGLLSFLSPCVLPLVPGYISIISGFSLEQLKGKIQDASLKRSVMLSSLMFILGFTISFVALGATATTLGKFLLTRMPYFRYIAGIIMIVFALHVLGIFRIKALYQDTRLHSVQTSGGMWGALVLGFVFALGWSPCLGPILSGILGLASEQETVLRGMFLLLVYSAGLGVPFLMTSLGLNRFLTFYNRFKRHFRALEIVSGILILGVGILIFTDQMTRLNQYFQWLSDFEYRIEEAFIRLIGG